MVVVMIWPLFGTLKFTMAKSRNGEEPPNTHTHPLLSVSVTAQRFFCYTDVFFAVEFFGMTKFSLTRGTRVLCFTFRQLIGGINPEMNSENLKYINII